MRSSVTVSAILIILLLSTWSAAIQAHASAQPFPLELGYGLTSLTPVSSGIPVYTVGDTLWALSNFNATVSALLTPPNSVGAFARSLETGVPVPIHKFAPSDSEGTWTLHLLLHNKQALFMPVHFVKADNHRPVVGVSQSTLKTEQLLLGFDITSVDAYDEEACLGTKQSEGAAVIHIPGSVGTGDLRIMRLGDGLTLSTSASFGSPFTFWLEVYHPFSFNINDTTEFISRNLRAATSTPIAIGSSGSSNTTLNWEMSPRVGRYEARAFFQSSSGIYVAQARILIPNQGSWLSLDSCQLKTVDSSSIAYVASLKGDTTTWPTALYLMYRAFGVESASVVPLRLNLSKATFVAGTWQAPLDDLQVRVEPDSNLLQYTSANGSIYVIAKSYPLDLHFSAGIGNHFVSAGCVTVLGPYAVQNASFSVGKLTVHVLNQEAPSAGVSVNVADMFNGTVMKKTNIDAYATFFVPAGTYAVTASLAGQSRTVQASVSNGNETVLNMELPTVSSVPSESLTSLQYILIITGVIGVIVNFLVWVIRPRLSR